MANIDIRGTIATFPGIPYSTLQLYDPQPNTHLALWHTPDPVAAIYLRMHLNMLERIQAIERLFQFDMEGDRPYYAALFDYIPASTRLLSDLDNYLGILCGTSYRLICPWRIARHEDAKSELDNLIRMDDDLLETYRIKAQTGRPLPKAFVEQLLISAQPQHDMVISTMAATAGNHWGTPDGHEGLKHLQA